MTHLIGTAPTFSMTHLRAYGLTLACGLSIGCCSPAYADSCLPMLQVMAVPMWLSLLVVVPLEAWIARKVLRTDRSKSVKVSTAANLVSSFLGVPLTWGALAFCQVQASASIGQLMNSLFSGHTPNVRDGILFTVLTSPMPYPIWSYFYWMLPAAALILCIPFFFISVWSEYLVAQLIVGSHNRKEVLQWSWIANLASYSLIALIIVALGIASIWRHEQIARDEEHCNVDRVSADRLWELAISRAGSAPQHSADEFERNRELAFKYNAASKQELQQTKALLEGRLNSGKYDLALGQVYQKLGDFDKAKDFYETVLRSKEDQSLGATKHELAMMDYALMERSCNPPDLDRAETFYKAAIKSMTKSLNWSFYDGPLDQAYCGLAEVLIARKQYGNAEQLLQNAIDEKCRQNDFGEFNLRDYIGPMSLTLASAFIAEGKYQAAEHWIKQAFRCNDVLPQAAIQYGHLQELLGRQDLAQPWFARAAQAQRERYSGL